MTENSQLSSLRPCRAALYRRASTARKITGSEDYTPRPEIQQERLRRLCEQRGWQVVALYSDRASGRRDRRAGPEQLMAEARRGAFDVLAVTSCDRLARAVRHLVRALDEFREPGMDFVSLREAVDTSTPWGKATFTILAAMAELESALRAERTRAGLEYACRHGTRSGRPIGRQPRRFDRMKAVALRRQGYSDRKMARLLKVPVATLYGALRRFCSENPRAGEAAKLLENHERVRQGVGV